MVDRMINEAIILAGGLGTRLRAVIGRVPKPMAMIGSRPFLEFVLDYLISQGITRIIFSVGYRRKAISSYFGHRYKSCEIIYAVEYSRLGTGGAIRRSLEKARSRHVVVVNGDSLFRLPLKKMWKFHLKHKAGMTVALKPMKHGRRYAHATLSGGGGKITGFRKCLSVQSGLINGGIYILPRNLFNCFALPRAFSFEDDFINPSLDKIKIYGFISSGYFIDIGVPGDYQKAQIELKKYWNK